MFIHTASLLPVIELNLTINDGLAFGTQKLAKRFL